MFAAAAATAAVVVIIIFLLLFLYFFSFIVAAVSRAADASVRVFLAGFLVNKLFVLFITFVHTRAHTHFVTPFFLLLSC